MKRDEPWASVDDVKRELGVERTKATELMRVHLEGFKPVGLNAWRCTWRAIRLYKRIHEEGSPWHSENFRSSNATDTGTATSDTQMERAASALSTSETMAVPQASGPRALTAATVGAKKPSFRYDDLSAFKPSPEYEAMLKKAMDQFRAWRCPKCGAPGHIRFDQFQGDGGFFLEQDRPHEYRITCSKGCSSEQMGAKP